MMKAATAREQRAEPPGRCPTPPHRYSRTRHPRG